jgi:hypothetical protein
MQHMQLYLKHNASDCLKPETPPPVSIDGEEEYKVEDVIASGTMSNNTKTISCPGWLLT